MSVNETSRFRTWMFTFSCEFHPDDCKEWNVIRDKIKNKKIRAAIISDVEIGDEANNYEHRHGVIQFENVIRFSTLKKMLPKAHIEVCRDVDAAIDYCTKKCTADSCLIYEDNFKKHGGRYDLKHVINECKDITEVMTEFPDVYGKYRKGLIDLMKLKNEDDAIREWAKVKEIEVDYFTGDSGSGKTYRAKAITNQYLDEGKKVAAIDFDVNGFATIIGSRECELLILNEFRDSCMKFNEFLGLLTSEGGVNVKGEDKVFFKNCKRIIITSIIEPWMLYKKIDESKEQIKRRISTIYLCSKDCGIYKCEPIEWKHETEMKQEVFKRRMEDGVTNSDDPDY